MRRMILILVLALATLLSCSAQDVLKRDLELRKTAPVLNLNGSGASIKFYNNDVVLQHSNNTLTMSGGDFALIGGYSLLMTGSVGSTADRILKGWFTNLEITQMPTVSGVSLFSIFPPINNPEFTGIIKVGTDTAATRAYARAYGGLPEESITAIVSDSLDALREDVVMISDTSAMLTPYLLASEAASAIDTTSLSDRIDLKLSISDTSAMLDPYITKLDANQEYVAHTDTATMLDPYFLETDNLDFSQVNMTEGDYAELEDYAVMLADTTLLKTFEFGSGLMKDTADFYNGAIKSFYNAGSDTLAITSLMGVMAEGAGTESVGVQVSWHTTLKSGSATNLNSSAFTVTSLTTGNEDVSFANAKIPPKNFVWATLSGITSDNKPSYLAANLSGYRISGIASTIPDEECTYTQNLVLYSEQLNLGYWNKFDISVTATDAEYDLDGNATLEEVTTTNIAHRMHSDEVDVIAGETYRFSFDVKRGTMTGLAYGVYDITNAGWIADGVSYYSSTSASVSRVSFEFTAPAGCTQVWVYPLRNSGATGTVYLGRVQIEENGSCYVETTSSIITP